MPPQKYQVVSPSTGISCHAWNADKSMLALCANDNRLQIYEGCNSPTFSSWRLAHVLEEHDLLITGISWSPVTNKIVTCSHDRNAFVWSYDAAQGKWNPILCALKLNRAALDVQWSPSGTKFAVASGAKTVAVSRLDTSQSTEWYVSRLMKGHKSTVQQVAWHPNDLVLATACTDFKCRVVSAMVAEVDTNPNPAPFGTVKPFGEAYHVLSCAGWVTAVAWSPSGSTLAYAGQDSTVHFIRFDQGSAVVEQRVRYPLLPVGCLTFLSERAVVGGGHDMNPLVFASEASGHWSFLRRLDEKSRGPAKQAGAVSSMASARAMFQAKTTRGQTASGGAGQDLWTQHANSIVGMESMGHAEDPTCSKFSTCGLDGRIVVWDVPTLDIDMQALGL
ncbi:unnamed protein product [Ascophyllum nodosum]